MKVTREGGNCAPSDQTRLVTDSNGGHRVATSERAEAFVVEAGAQAVADIKLAHRTDIRTLRRLVQTLMNQVAAESEEPEAFYKLGEALFDPRPFGKDVLNDAYMAAISLPERIKGVKALADALERLVRLEREAWGINNDAAGGRTVIVRDLTGRGFSHALPPIPVEARVVEEEDQ